jgi:hypothetical protein
LVDEELGLDPELPDEDVDESVDFESPDFVSEDFESPDFESFAPGLPASALLSEGRESVR